MKQYARKHCRRRPSLRRQPAARSVGRPGPGSQAISPSASPDCEPAHHPGEKERAEPAQSAEGKRRMTNSIRSPASSRQDSISVM
jgi:hypothetical protein